jgi:hypothetical protein
MLCISWLCFAVLILRAEMNNIKFHSDFEVLMSKYIKIDKIN